MSSLVFVIIFFFFKIFDMLYMLYFLRGTGCVQEMNLFFCLPVLFFISAIQCLSVFFLSIFNVYLFSFCPCLCFLLSHFIVSKIHIFHYSFDPSVLTFSWFKG